MIIVDASVVITAIIGQDRPLRSRAQQALLDPDETFAAPSVLVPEVIGRIAGLVRGGKLEPKAASKAVEQFTRLGIELYDPGYDAAKRLLELGDNLQTMDAIYVVLGELFGADVISLDGSMLRAAQSVKATCRVREP